MQKRSKLLILLLCLALLAGCAKTAEPEAEPQPAEWTAVTVTDDLGREVALENEPQRVACLIGSFAETWQLAGGEMAAAVRDAWDDFDLGLGEDVINLGKYQDVNMEILFAAEPDLVIASANTKGQVELKETLESSGIPVLYFSVYGFEDYLRMLEVCTQITGRTDLYEENGLKIQQNIEEVKLAAQKAVEEQGAPRVLFIRAAASFVRAKGSDDTVLGLMLKDLGCINIADGSDLLDDLSMEKIIEEDPDMIFIVQQGNDTEGTQQALQDALTGNPAWAGLKAVKEDKVFYMDKNLYQLKPNARWGEAYEKLTEIVYGK
ncbi:MAG: ABC transporter substrate-binding protein [Firmicutes bacterium]|nr:ABC transporter substrate-binding protein [Bacillota bacterium]